MIALALTLDDLLFLHDESVLPQVALVGRDGQLSYGELAARVEILASRLAALGVRRGERVVVHLAKSSEEIAAMFACWRIGAVAVNVNVQWTLAQLGYVIDDSGARILLCDARRALELGASGRHSLERVIVKGECPAYSGFEAWPTTLSERFEKPRVLDSDLAAILYTSGSTGAPKGVMLTHLNLLLGARSVARYLGLRASDRLLSLLPFSFDYGLNQLLSSFLLGATLVLAPIAMPSEIVKVLVSERCTGFAAVPPVWSQVVRYLEAVKTELPALRYVTNSGGKIPEPILRAMPKVFPGAQIYLMYGLTEAFRSTYLRPERFHDKLGSIGQAIPDVEVFVVVKDRGLAGPGEEGELVHRGSLISAGYWNKPEATAEKIRVCPELASLLGDEKVVYSGDTVRVDAEGDLWFVGRADSMIKSMGFRLSPTEVEEIVHKSGLVQEAVAFGFADELAGQVVHLCVAKGAEHVDQEALMAHCRAHMPHYMLPRRIHHWPSDMPRTASGKIDVPALLRAIQKTAVSEVV